MRHGLNFLSFSLLLLFLGCNVKPGGRTSELPEGHPSYFRSSNVATISKSGEDWLLKIPAGGIILGTDKAHLTLLATSAATARNIRRAYFTADDVLNIISVLDVAQDGSVTAKITPADNTMTAERFSEWLTSNAIVLSLVGGHIDALSKPRDPLKPQVLIKLPGTDNFESGPAVNERLARLSLTSSKISDGGTASIIGLSSARCFPFVSKVTDQDKNPYTGDGVEVRIDVDIDAMKTTKGPGSPTRASLFQNQTDCELWRQGSVFDLDNREGKVVTVAADGSMQNVIGFTDPRGSEAPVTYRVEVTEKGESISRAFYRFSLLAQEPDVGWVDVSTSPSNISLVDKRCYQLEMAPIKAFMEPSALNWSSLGDEYFYLHLATTKRSYTSTNRNVSLAALPKHEDYSVRFFESMTNCQQGVNPVQRYFGKKGTSRVFFRYDTPATPTGSGKFYLTVWLRAGILVNGSYAAGSVEVQTPSTNP